ncbi:MAG: tetratricopeptide repeat protein [Gammaproteobacteria bacterium]|nr:tetratricopeptide repeat protein [Gammaproteobacteria bacterium]
MKWGLSPFLLLAACAGGGPPEAARFAGSEACAACHAEQAAAWRESQHHHAMQPATPASVLGDFSDATFDYAGITTTFTRRGDRYFVRTDGPDGQLADVELRYTLGVAPLQQYLVELPGGRLQALGHAWDSRPREAGGQRWFHLYPGQALRAGNPLHWTGIDQNWNSMCADCHTTGLRKNYDAARRSYSTSWAELGVGCEACHGPGSRHIEQPGQPGTGITADRGIDICGRCHARREQLTDAVTAADPLHAGFRVALLEPGLYYADGQMRDEVFNYGSFVQSRKHAVGITCNDCHDPHRAALRIAGDAACFQCHAPPTYATPQHHFHAPDSAGSRCSACHLPATTYMQIDPRHDHAFRVPRPLQAAAVGAPDACTHCHRDRDAAWAAREIRARHPDHDPEPPHFSQAFVRYDRGDPEAAGELDAIAADPLQPAIVRTSARARLDTDRPGWERTATLAPATPLTPEAWRRAQEFNADRPEAQVNLGLWHLAHGDPAAARSALETALQLDRTFLPAWINLADLYRSQDDEAAAERTLRAALPHAGDSGIVAYALGLALVRQRRRVEAIGWLGEAARREPGNARFAEAYALAARGNQRQ